MPISDLCSKELVSMQKGATLQDAARLMKKHHVGGIVVVESQESNKPVGIITDRDIVLHVVADGLPVSTSVQTVMSKDIAKVSAGAGIAEVVDQMEEKAIRRMIVVDKAGMACGLVSSDDILQLVARELNGLGKLVGRQLEKESKHRAANSQLMM